MWEVVYSKHAIKDSKKISESGLKNKTEILIEIIRNDPFQNPPPYEKLIGDLLGAYSRRINIQHRLVYQVSLIKKLFEFYECGLIMNRKTVNHVFLLIYKINQLINYM